jgi:hypothetical protein
LSLADDARARLNHLLPLGQRQQSLPAPLRRLHRRILRLFLTQPRYLTYSDIKGLLTGADPGQALKVLAAADLVILDASSSAVVGVYPVTLEETPHRLRFNEVTVNATSALDALAVGCLLHSTVEISSRCAVSGQPIDILQQDHTILTTNAPVTGSTAVRLGIQWGERSACAAHGWCRGVVFLRNEAAARAWQGFSSGETRVLSLPDAVELAAACYAPLLEER